jgi:hypothetical protein
MKRTRLLNSELIYEIGKIGVTAWKSGVVF